MHRHQEFCQSISARGSFQAPSKNRLWAIFAIPWDYYPWGANPRVREKVPGKGCVVPRESPWRAAGMSHRELGASLARFDLDAVPAYFDRRKPP